MKKLLLLFLFVLHFNLLAVNLNTASLQELKSLNGIGEKTAKAIIEYRKSHKFKTVDEIMHIRGIGKKKFEKIRGELSV